VLENVKISELAEVVEYENQRFFCSLPSGEIAVRSFAELTGAESLIYIDGGATKTTLAADLIDRLSGTPYVAATGLEGPTFTLAAYPGNVFQRVGDLEVDNQPSENAFFPLAGTGAVLGFGSDRVYSLLATARKIQYNNLAVSLAPVVQAGVGYWSISGTFRVS